MTMQNPFTLTQIKQEMGRGPGGVERTKHLHWVIRGGHRDIVFNGTATYAEERLNDLVQAWLAGRKAMASECSAAVPSGYKDGGHLPRQAYDLSPYDPTSRPMPGST